MLTILASRFFKIKQHDHEEKNLLNLGSIWVTLSALKLSEDLIARIKLKIFTSYSPASGVASRDFLEVKKGCWSGPEASSHT